MAINLSSVQRVVASCSCAQRLLRKAVLLFSYIYNDSAIALLNLIKVNLTENSFDVIAKLSRRRLAVTLIRRRSERNTLRVMAGKLFGQVIIKGRSTLPGKENVPRNCEALVSYSVTKWLNNNNYNQSVIQISLALDV